MPGGCLQTITSFLLSFVFCPEKTNRHRIIFCCTSCSSHVTGTPLTTWAFPTIILQTAGCNYVRRQFLGRIKVVWAPGPRHGVKAHDGTILATWNRSGLVSACAWRCLKVRVEEGKKSGIFLKEVIIWIISLMRKHMHVSYANMRSWNPLFRSFEAVFKCFLGGNMWDKLWKTLYPITWSCVVQALSVNRHKITFLWFL